MTHNEEMAWRFLELVKLLWSTKIDWKATSVNPYVFSAVFEGKTVFLRLNNFPEEVLCSVIADNLETDLDDFPQSWTLPAHRIQKK